MQEELKKEIMAEIKACGDLKGKMRNNCMYDFLHEITELQDKANLNVDWGYNYSTRFASNMIDHANAVILGVSSWKGDIRPVLRHGYVHEKIRSLIDDWNAMAHDYALVVDNENELYQKMKINEYYHVKSPPNIENKESRDYWHKELFEGFE
jgi:hypothetical protein